MLPRPPSSPPQPRRTLHSSPGAVLAIARLACFASSSSVSRRHCFPRHVSCCLSSSASQSPDTVMVRWRLLLDCNFLTPTHAHTPAPRRPQPRPTHTLLSPASPSTPHRSGSLSLRPPRLQCLSFSCPLRLSSPPFPSCSRSLLCSPSPVCRPRLPPSLPASLNRPTFHCAEIMIPVTRDKIEAACPACLPDTSDALIAPCCNS